MNDIIQIQVISNSLLKEKEKYMNELSKINININNKKMIIDRMQSYQNEYLAKCNLQNAKTIPILYSNINMFIRKIDNIITQTQAEILHLQKIKKGIFETIEKINKKIDLMNVFIDKNRRSQIKKAERLEQTMLDDITSTLEERSEYE